jgi:uncharacterized protein YdhG (YjbR/CyaY superfamily)
MIKKEIKTIDEYIEAAPKEVRKILEKLRQTIKKAAPGAEETISYRMPAFRMNGKVLVYFAAFKNHIGFFPTALGVSAFRKELSGYKFSKGAIQFPLGKPIPWNLVKRIVKFKVKENFINYGKQK